MKLIAVISHDNYYSQVIIFILVVNDPVMFFDMMSHSITLFFIF
jgi:hypothetical protein